MWNRSLALLTMCCALTAQAQAQAPSAAPPFALSVQHADDAADGKVYRISSSATVTAPPAAVWRVLTDYDHLAGVVPGLKSARVLARDGNDAVVEQLGAARFLLFSHAIRLVVRVHERPQTDIDVSFVEGDMRVYRSSWHVTHATGGGTRIAYDSTMAPAFYVPAMIGTSVVRRDVARMMAAVLARIESKSAVSAPSAPE